MYYITNMSMFDEFICNHNCHNLKMINPLSVATFPTLGLYHLYWVAVAVTAVMLLIDFRKKNLCMREQLILQT